MTKFSRFVKNIFPNIYIALVFIFLYLPIMVLIVFSFNKVPKSFVWGGFTLANYSSLFSGNDGGELLNSLLTTLRIATVASVISTVIAVIACLGLTYFSKKLQSVVMNVTYIPNIMPELVTGISFMLLFSFLGVQKGEFTLLLSHIAFCVPFAVLSIHPKLKQLDKNLSEAAQDLGATQWQTITKVIIPEIMPGIVSSILLTFTLSVDDYLISNFNVDSTVQTLPMKIYSMAKFGVNPKMNALTTIMFIVIFVLLLLANIRSLRESHEKRKKHKGEI
ncbi:MAG TPA: ABC transporter permease [Bacillota bacterium]|nr:ABC transporter permease [Bacillota bacterium]HPE38692.1 ABC transporter permease [Bacillota bacterium]